MYEYGEGCKKDLHKALEIEKIAFENGYQKAEEFIDEFINQIEEID